MTHKANSKSIKNAINDYASAYQSLEALQQKHVELLQKGDQKTGVIGEFYSLLYLKNKFPNAEIEYADTGQKGWDLQVAEEGKTDLRVQVKTVSGYSNTRTISPIHRGWDDLFLLFVDKQFKPIGFWSVSNNIFKNSEDRLEGKRMPIPGNKRSGSRIFKKKIDRLLKLIETLEKI